MTILFEAYQLLSNSNLFDAAFYVGLNPDILRQNIDPLTHYLEIGARERLDPSAKFDTRFYLSQCQGLGETPANALLHYLTSGAARGLRPHPEASAEPARPVSPPTGGDSFPTDRLLFVDVPRIVNGMAEAPIYGGLSIAGWALARDGIEEIDVALDGERAAVAYYGIRRPDVASEHGSWKEALQSGFAAHVPPKRLTAGRHVVTVTARDGSGVRASVEFAINVESAPEDRGPSSLRRKMSQSEANAHFATLKRLGWRPAFRVLLRLSGAADELAAVRRTLLSLSRQVYPDWELCLCPSAAAGPKRKPKPKITLAAVTQGFEECAHRVILAAAAKPPDIKRNQRIFALRPGDEFGCDALLEFALLGGFERNADLIYCDERRVNPADGQVDAFFKPQWSPDLLLSNNYIGRSWCASGGLLERAALTAGELLSQSDYAIALRLSEAASGIRRIAALLFQPNAERLDTEREESRALSEALKRRSIDGDVREGCAAHYYRVKRKGPRDAHVSIIIPTCAADGLIKTCIESLRDRTAYRHYEIVCVENIPKERADWKPWLARNADGVVTQSGPFNWSRFNNRAAARAKGAHFLFLNDDIEIIEPDWLDALLEHGQRPEVGVVGPQLLYPDRSVQHAGMTLDGVGRGRHAFRHLKHDEVGYFGLALSQRNVMSVTGACLMTRREVFERLGHFEEAHAIVNGDLDYCLRSWSSGLLNVYTPYARLVHHELASRSGLGEKYNAEVFERHWREAIAQGDPYFNPHLSLEHDQVEIEREPVEAIYAGHPLMAREEVRRILIVKLDHIGDAITALEPVRRLKRAFPAAKITMLAGRGTLPLWKSEPSVDETLEFNLFHVRSGLGTIPVGEPELAALGTMLAEKRFDLAIDLRKQPDTRHVLQRSAARITAGFDHIARFPWLDIAIEWDEDVPLRAKRAHVSEDLNMLVDVVAARCEAVAAAIPAPKGSLQLKGNLTKRLFSRPLVCIHAAAGSEMRQWPLAKFAELANLLLDEGVNVALIGGPDESKVAEGVLKGVARRAQVYNLVGKTNLTDLPTLLARAALFVGNNSGPQHLAASLGVPTVGIHSGVVDAHEWGPAGPRAVAIRRHMSCSPCFIEKAKDCPRKLLCLTGLESREVFRRCQRMLLGVKRRTSAK